MLWPKPNEAAALAGGSFSFGERSLKPSLQCLAVQNFVSRKAAAVCVGGTDTGRGGGTGWRSNPAPSAWDILLMQRSVIILFVTSADRPAHVVHALPSLLDASGVVQSWGSEQGKTKKAMHQCAWPSQILERRLCFFHSGRGKAQGCMRAETSTPNQQTAGRLRKDRP